MLINEYFLNCGNCSEIKPEFSVTQCCY